MAAVCGARRGASAMTVQSALAQANPCAAAMRTTSVSSATLSAPSQTGSVSGKWRPEVAQAHRAQHGVGQRMAHGVGVAVAAQAARPLDHDAAQDEGAVRVLREAVDVDALADAHAHVTSALAPSSRSAAPRSSGSVILRLPGSPGHDLHGAAQRLHQHGVVGGTGRGAGGVGPAQQGGPEGLRGLHGHQCGAVEGGGDAPGLVHGLDGVTRRHAGHGPVRSPGRPPPRRRRRTGAARPAAAPRRAPRSPRPRRGPRPGRSAPSRPAWRRPSTTASAPWRIAGRRLRRARTRTTPAEPGRHAATAHSSTGRPPSSANCFICAETPAGAPATTIDHTCATVRPGPAIRSAPRSGALRPSPRPR